MVELKLKSLSLNPFHALKIPINLVEQSIFIVRGNVNSDPVSLDLSMEPNCLLLGTG